MMTGGGSSQGRDRKPAARNMLVLFLCILCLVPHARAGVLELRDKQVAAVVIGQGRKAEGLQRSAQSRLESILVDNGFTVLDRQKAERMKDANRKLQDPAVFITAEDFIKMAEDYKIHALIVLYLHVDANEGLADYFNATAQVDVRVVDDISANVQAFNTQPMGTRGIAPSQGLTEKSALLNAVYRAVDLASEQMELELSDRTRLHSVRLKLGTPVSEPELACEEAAANEAALHALAELEKANWRVEEGSATARSPDGVLAAVGGYIRDTDHRRRPSRLYGSRVHVMDIKTGKTIHIFECSPVEKKGRDERGTKRVLDVAFVASWRYLAAVTGNHVILWDTETGEELGRSPHAEPLKSGRICLMRDTAGARLTVGSGTKVVAYPIIRDR